MNGSTLIEAPTNFELLQVLRDIQQRLDRLGERVEGVEHQLGDGLGERLERLADSLTAGQWAPLPEECRTRQCTYFQHYLAYGPADLTHDGFHAAEKRCHDAQDRCMNFHEKNGYPNGQNTACCKTALYWEQAVRA
jgi:hypothetical protein